MIPEQFREFDRVARECFGFLVSERGFSEPTVEFWRDYYLAYELPDDVKINVGTERGMRKVGWFGVFINIAYRDTGHVLFFLDSLLEELGVPTDAERRLWPNNIEEYAAVVRQNFEKIVDYVRARGVEKAEEGPGPGPRGSFLVLRAADGSMLRTMCSGAGVHFWRAQFLPIDRETFWEMVDRGYSPSYMACRCPSCGYVGNVGHTQTRAFSGAAFFVWWLFRIGGKKKQADSDSVAWCPRCGHESKDFTPEGPPPTIADGVNPLRSR